MQSPNPSTLLRRYPAQIAAVAASLLASALSAQTAPAASNQPAADGDVVELSVFNVNTDRDYGYRASNSIAGTRSDTPIKDVPLNIQVFTKDLYDDLIITNQVDLERYNAAMVNGGADARSENPIQQAYNAFIFRGFVQNWGLRDGIRQYDPVDTAGLARVEVVKGPAGALYGLSYPGGVMNNITKDVDFRENFASVRLTGYNEGGYRASIDANFSGKVAVGQMGVRYNGANMVTEDDRAHSKGAVRYSQINVAYAPYTNTRVSFLAERGYREKPNGLGYFTRGEVDAAGNPLGNGSAVPLQEYHPEIPYEWNWANAQNMRSLDTKLYRGSVSHKIGDLSLSGYIQYSTRDQIDGQGWDANGSGGADSWEAGGGWIINPDGSEVIRSGYSYRDWTNTMHAYGGTGVYKLDFDVIKNTFTFGAAAWTENFLSRASRANDFIEYPVRANIPITIPYAPPPSLRPYLTDNGWTHEDNSNDYYFASWQGGLIDNRLKLNLSVNRTNLQLLQWANGEDPEPSITKQSKTSPMVGGVFDITKEVSVFAVHSTSLFPTTDKNSLGAQLPPVVGKSYEGGVKIDMADGKLSGTLSYYFIEQTGGAQNDPTAENRNTRDWDTMTPDQRAVRFPGQTRASLLGDLVPGATQESKGYEADIVYQPLKNWQLVLSYAHNDVEVVDAINPATIGTATIGSIKDQWSLLTKYTFTEGPAKGLAIGLGFQAAGKAVQDYQGPGGSARYNPRTNYLEVFAGYRFKMFGYDSIVQLNAKNITQQEEFVGWRATGSSSIISTTRYEASTPVRYSLTLGIDL